MDVVQWFADRGVTCYQQQIDELRSQRQEIAVEGGISMLGCHRTSLALIDADIASIEQAARDRYDDLASDWRVRLTFC